MVVSFININDLKENKERSEIFYKELTEKHEASRGYAFRMKYTYDIKKNIGFFSGGGFIETDYWERIIRDAWSNQGVISVSLCADEKINKNKLEKIESFWSRYEELFKN